MLDYHLLDVFTDRPFTGNQLAVFVDPPRLDTDRLQRLARELNLAETVFAWSTDDPSVFDVRIFTPAVEMPFAGHPTIGATVHLATSGGSDRLVLREPIGDVVVDVERAGDGSVLRAWLTTATLPRVVGSPVEAGLAASWLGLEPEDLRTDLPAVTCTAGVEFLCVPLVSRTALSSAVVTAGTGVPLYPFVLDGEASASVRMFGPGLGIAEDPATGAAAAAFAAYLNTYVDGADGTRRWTLTQGVEMGRPSELLVELSVAGGSLVGTRVGGRAVAVGRGTITAEP